MFSNEATHSEPSFITPLTDISANIFAIMILIFVLMLAVQQTPDELSVAVEEDFSVVKRTPMTAAELFQHLYDRRSASKAIRLDLQENNITFIDSDGTVRKLSGEAIGKQLPRLLPEAGDGPVRLYVFSHNWHPDIISLLHMSERSWQEISVPQALRSRENTGWSEGIAALLARPVDRGVFEDALARLLAAKRPGANSDSRTAAHAQRQLFNGSDMSFQKEPLAARVAKWWRRIIGVIIILGAFLLIFLIERRAVSLSAFQTPNAPRRKSPDCHK